ncbi:MAG: response regulator transcription factor [Hyphomicrobiaceae bacterium]
MKILIIDDHAVLREGVRRLLATIPGAEISEASTTNEALAKLRLDPPHVVILDINLNGSSGLELLQRLKSEQKSVRVVMFTMYTEPSYIARAIKAGAAGYVSKSAPAGELVTAVRKVAEGERYIDREIASDLYFNRSSADDPLQKLTNREVEILRLLGEGKSLTQIASTFGIAYKTVANSCGRLKEKLGLERTADLIRFSLDTRTR